LSNNDNGYERKKTCFSFIINDALVDMRERERERERERDHNLIL